MTSLIIRMRALFAGGMHGVRNAKEEGATAVEYGLMVALIAAVVAAVVLTLGTNTRTKFNNVATCVGQAAPTAADCPGTP
jgi:pilus assembly protein Flp/PilA